ncbi:MAG: triacylglycerol lipase [Ruminococcus flavefaciens]|nr:triacylglycerol lipase [Ruminococcus flavefaciens]MCM1228988.1 triacylglycerol lipase [Ruminococcus flavefaciens]
MKKILDLIFLLIFCNIIPLWTELDIATEIKTAVTVVLSLMFVVDLIRSEKIPVKSFRLSSVKRGTSLIWISGMAIIPETAVIIVYLICSDATVLPKIFAVVMPILAIILVFMAGFLRTAIGSKQIKLMDYIFLLIFWWTPVINLILIYRFYCKAKKEYIFETDKLELENARAENEICKTKYPVVMVHGIFFRDWQLMNYWGRVPASLIRNGADVYYGNQQSARSIPDSAEELRQAVMKVIAETGAEKVNIIAHSKGGLDTRYAISSLGLDKYVATLTTINTPHGGCDMVDYLLGKFSPKFCNWVARRYNKIFTVLGDKEPDFMAGIKDLSPSRLKELEDKMADSPDVSYRSCMSVMKNVFSTSFLPLIIGHLTVKKLNGDNDGLVWVGSAKHGEFKLVKASGIRGISHGDTIDLFRENIEGYDVREFYINLVAELKQQGY